MDYYSTLGINKNASDDEIRKAYKSKSMKHHPDRGGNEEEFKKVNEAYQTLKDPQKKQMYDRYGTSDPQQMGGGPSGWGDMNFGNGSFQFNGSPQDFEEMFGSFFGGGFRQRPRPPRNKNVQLKVILTLKEILEGKQINGSISIGPGNEKLVDVKIPPGVENGDVIKYQHLGDDTIRQAPPGDLLIQVQEQRDPNFTRQGADVKTVHTVSVFDAMLGTTIIVNNFDGGSISIRVPQGTQPNTILSCSSKGLPSKQNGRRGNLYVEIKVEIPKDLDEEQKRKINEIRT